ncbi:MAG: hypothetical protein JWR80_8923 [Bradyrhizobium sp.]|nr:hypothetical protein [Bradyrhizobium sp.]
MRSSANGEDPINILGALSDSIGLKTSEFVNVAISALGAVGTFAAAVAAWRAARAATETVTEMREARHQAVRPQFDIQIPSDLKLIWKIDSPPELFVRSPGAEGDAASIVMINVGFASAINVIIEGRSTPSIAFSEADGAKLGAYFTSRNMTFVRSGPCESVSAWGESHSDDMFGIFTCVGYQGKHVAVAKPGEPIAVPLSLNSFNVAFFDVLRSIVDLDGNIFGYKFWKQEQVIFDETIVRYVSQSGEQLSQRIRARIRPSFLYQFKDGVLLDTKRLAADWDTVELLFGVTLEEG